MLSSCRNQACSSRSGRFSLYGRDPWYWLFSAVGPGAGPWCRMISVYADHLAAKSESEVAFTSPLAPSTATNDCPSSFENAMGSLKDGHR